MRAKPVSNMSLAERVEYLKQVRPHVSVLMDEVLKATSQLVIELVSVEYTGLVFQFKDKEKIERDAPSVSMYALMVQIAFDQINVYSFVHQSNFNDDWFIAVSMITPEKE